MISDDEIESRIREAIAYATQHGATVNVEAAREALIRHRDSGERGTFFWDSQTHEVHWAWLS